MSGPVFVDTAALYALFLPGDQNHAAAREELERLRRADAPLVTTEVVLLESYILVHARSGRPGLMRFRDSLARSTWLDPRPVSHPQQEMAWRLLESHGDKDWSFVDATSFVVMRARKIRRAFSFDHHFAQAGFEMLPAPR